MNSIEMRREDVKGKKTNNTKKRGARIRMRNEVEKILEVSRIFGAYARATVHKPNVTIYKFCPLGVICPLGLMRLSMRNAANTLVMTIEMPEMITSHTTDNRRGIRSS